MKKCIKIRALCDVTHLWKIFTFFFFGSISFHNTWSDFNISCQYSSKVRWWCYYSCILIFVRYWHSYSVSAQLHFSYFAPQAMLSFHFKKVLIFLPTIYSIIYIFPASCANKEGFKSLALISVLSHFVIEKEVEEIEKTKIPLCKLHNVAYIIFCIGIFTRPHVSKHYYLKFDIYSVFPFISSSSRLLSENPAPPPAPLNALKIHSRRSSCKGAVFFFSYLTILKWCLLVDDEGNSNEMPLCCLPFIDLSIGSHFEFLLDRRSTTFHLSFLHSSPLFSSLWPLFVNFDDDDYHQG